MTEIVQERVIDCSKRDLPPIDLSMAENFLSALDKTAVEFSFQTFFDQKKPTVFEYRTAEAFERNLAEYKKGQAKCSRAPHASLTECLPDLNEAQSHGGGVFVTVNKTNLKGRRAANIVEIRAQFTDDDGNLRIPFALKPSIVVESVRGPHNYYLLKKDEPIELFTMLQLELAKNLKTDTSVKDLPRVMRLPGFFHLKDRSCPQMIYLKEINAIEYSCWEILDALMANSGGAKCQR